MLHPRTLDLWLHDMTARLRLLLAKRWITIERAADNRMRGRTMNPHESPLEKIDTDRFLFFSFLLSLLFLSFSLLFFPLLCLPLPLPLASVFCFCFCLCLCSSLSFLIPSTTTGPVYFSSNNYHWDLSGGIGLHGMVGRMDGRMDG
ncbi:hypothetical protein EYC84_006510 [Monilinia fructicola]|uniref:Uncharacterized protein n=1 Tax=Monilinia fructicola TaxID=38448 RepID=A0A5M9K7E7_MONFR|nr:hypothetical protein EYC84_006510 [Monilinia fructicola]